jgi:hypothetical protein
MQRPLACSNAGFLDGTFQSGLELFRNIPPRHRKAINRLAFFRAYFCLNHFPNQKAFS